MKRIAILIILIGILHFLQAAITQTLTLDEGSLNLICGSVNGFTPIAPDPRPPITANTFLADTKQVIGGDLIRNDLVATREPDYQLFKDLRWMAGYLQGAIFAVAPDNPQAYINLIISGHHPTPPTQIDPEYNGINDPNLWPVSGPEELFNYFTSIHTDTNAQSRTEYLCYMTNYATAIFDAMYCYNDSLDSNNIPCQSVQYLANLDKLRGIVVSCTDLMYYIKTKYDYLSTYTPDGNYIERRHYWGLPNYGVTDAPTQWDLQDGSTNVYLPRFFLIQDRLLVSAAWGYGSLILRKDAQNRSDNVTENKMNMYLGIIDNILTELPLLNFSTYISSNYPKTGLLDLHTSESGAYLESPGYFNWVMLWSNQFFATYARLGGVNYYRNEYIKGWIRNTIEKTTPYKADWAYDDSNNYGYGYVRDTNMDPLNTINSAIAYGYYYTDPEFQP